MLMKTDTLQDSLEKYRQKIAGGGRNKAAVYELALTSGRNYKPGDQISYYVKATPKKVAAYEAAKLASEFDPQNRLFVELLHRGHTEHSSKNHESCHDICRSIPPSPAGMRRPDNRRVRNPMARQSI